MALRSVKSSRSRGRARHRNQQGVFTTAPLSHSTGPAQDSARRTRQTSQCSKGVDVTTAEPDAEGFYDTIIVRGTVVDPTEVTDGALATSRKRLFLATATSSLSSSPRPVTPPGNDSPVRKRPRGRSPWIRSTSPSHIQDRGAKRIWSRSRSPRSSTTKPQVWDSSLRASAPAKSHKKISCGQSPLSNAPITFRKISSPEDAHAAPSEFSNSAIAPDYDNPACEVLAPTTADQQGANYRKSVKENANGTSKICQQPSQSTEIARTAVQRKVAATTGNERRLTTPPLRNRQVGKRTLRDRAKRLAEDSAQAASQRVRGPRGQDWIAVTESSRYVVPPQRMPVAVDFSRWMRGQNLQSKEPGGWTKVQEPSDPRKGLPQSFHSVTFSENWEESYERTRVQFDENEPPQASFSDCTTPLSHSPPKSTQETILDCIVIRPQTPIPALATPKCANAMSPLLTPLATPPLQCIRRPSLTSLPSVSDSITATCSPASASPSPQVPPTPGPLIQPEGPWRSFLMFPQEWAQAGMYCHDEPQDTRLATNWLNTDIDAYVGAFHDWKLEMDDLAAAGHSPKNGDKNAMSENTCVAILLDAARTLEALTALEYLKCSSG